MSELKRVLRWDEDRNPRLADLHPSFIDVDHVNRIIDGMKDHRFPSGVGFLGQSSVVGRDCERASLISSDLDQVSYLFDHSSFS